MRKLLWLTGGLLLSLGLHIFVAWLWFADNQSVGAPELGEGGMTITLAEPGALAGDEAAPEQPEAQNEHAEPAAETNREPEPEQEIETTTEPELETVVDTPTEPEPEKEPEPLVEQAEALTPARDIPDQQAMSEPEMLEPLPLPDVLAADGVAQPRKKRKKKTLAKVPAPLQPLGQAHRQETARAVIAKSALPQLTALQPLQIARRVTQRTMRQRPPELPRPQAAEMVQLARAVPPPPPSRPPQLTARPKTVTARPAPTKTEPSQARTVKASNAADTTARATSSAAAKGPSGDGAASAKGQQKTSGEGGRSVASQGGSGAGQARRRGGSQVGVTNSYMHTVRAWLERHKRYPRRAKRRRQEGIARLRFVVDRQGRVTSYKILKGTGHDRLDDAVHDMIRRAQPLPAFPPGLTHNSLALTVPVDFTLR